MNKINTNPKFATARYVAFNIIEDVLNPTAFLPPLYMLMNPETLKFNYRKIIHRYQTIACHVEEHWGDELDGISSNGSTGGFILDDIGYNTLGRSYTKAYFNFQDILDTYRNNGNVYANDGRVLRKGSICISYDEGTYFGLFESFNYEEDSEKPFKFTFDFEFKVTDSYTGV